MSIGDSSQVVVGQPVMAIGNPLGLSGTVTTGIVSALDRPVTTQAAESQPGPAGPAGSARGQLPGAQQQQTASDAVVTNAIQTSAAINPGNSGGALVTADGKLIGINSSIASLGASAGSQSGNIGIGFAIPVNEAKSIADQLIASGTAQHAYIGVSAGDTTVTDGNSKRQAALVQSVSQGTPAAQAGLQAKDAVIAIDGKPIDSVGGARRQHPRAQGRRHGDHHRDPRLAEAGPQGHPRRPSRLRVRRPVPPFPGSRNRLPRRGPSTGTLTRFP